MREKNLFIQELINKISEYDQNYFCLIKLVQVYEVKISITFRVQGNNNLGGL